MRRCALAVLLLMSACGPGSASSSAQYCNKVSTGVVLLFGYDVVWFANGDKFVDCSIGGSQWTVSDSNWWRAGQVGAKKGACSVVFDIDAASGGFWAFTDDNGPRADYSDSGSTSNGAGVVFAASDCQTN